MGHQSKIENKNDLIANIHMSTCSLIAIIKNMNMQRLISLLLLCTPLHSPPSMFLENTFMTLWDLLGCCHINMAILSLHVRACLNMLGVGYGACFVLELIVSIFVPINNAPMGRQFLLKGILRSLELRYLQSVSLFLSLGRPHLEISCCYAPNS